METKKHPAIIRHENGTYQLGSARFDSLNDLLEFDPSEALVLACDPYAIGAKLGQIAVALMEEGLDAEKLAQGLADSTDEAWSDGAAKLAAILQAFAKAGR